MMQIIAFFIIIFSFFFSFSIFQTIQHCGGGGGSCNGMCYFVRVGFNFGVEVGSLIFSVRIFLPNEIRLTLFFPFVIFKRVAVMLLLLLYYPLEPF